MLTLIGFGHFFGFTATVNYATTIFKDFKKFLESLLTEFEVEKLSKQKILYEQGYLIYHATLERLIKISDKVKANEFKQMKAQGDMLFALAEKAEIDANSFLNEIKYSIPYKKNFENRFQPLFPLAGTFSVIFLLFSSFAEANPNDHCICFNTIFFVGIVTVILAIGNYYGWFYTKNKDVSFRTFILTLELSLATIILWLVSRYITNSHSLEVFTFNKLNQTLILVFSISISSLGFIAIILKMIRVNYLANIKYKSFDAINMHLKKYLRMIKNHTSNP